LDGLYAGQGAQGTSGETYWAQTNVGINTSSNVGIGTTNPVTLLQVDRYGVKVGFGTFSAISGISTIIDSFNVDVTNFKVLEYALHFEYNDSVHAQKVLLMQNKTTAYHQEYGIMYDPSAIISIDSSIVGNNCVLEVIPQENINGLTTYRFVRNSVL
jgi:hypothetical protein